MCSPKILNINTTTRSCSATINRIVFDNPVICYTLNTNIGTIINRVVAYCIFGAVLGTVFAVAVYLSLDFIDDNLVNTRLSQEIDHLGTLYQNNIDLLVPASSNIEAYVGTALMPSYAKKMVSGIGEGIHEIYHQGIEYHVAVKVFPNRIEPLYLF